MEPCCLTGVNQSIVPSTSAPFRLPRPRARSARGPRVRLHSDDALRLGTLRPVDRLELHLRALRKRLEALACNRRMVDEQVLATIGRGDEPIPLRVVEPL